MEASRQGAEKDDADGKFSGNMRVLQRIIHSIVKKQDPRKEACKERSDALPRR